MFLLLCIKAQIEREKLSRAKLRVELRPELRAKLSPAELNRVEPRRAVLN